MANIDGKVTGLNKDVYQALQQIKSKNPGPLTQLGATKLTEAILKDGKIDAAEEDLINELCSDKVVMIEGQKTADFNPATLIFKGTSTEAKGILSSLRAVDPKLVALWDKGPSGYKELLTIHSRSPEDANKVKNVFMSKLGEAWQKSSFLNAFQGMRDFIGKVYTDMSQLEPAQFEQGKQLLYETCAQLDAGIADLIPDAAYDWLKKKA